MRYKPHVVDLLFWNLGAVIWSNVSRWSQILMGLRVVMFPFRVLPRCVEPELNEYGASL